MLMRWSGTMIPWAVVCVTFTLTLTLTLTIEVMRLCTLDGNSKRLLTSCLLDYCVM